MVMTVTQYSNVIQAVQSGGKISRLKVIFSLRSNLMVFVIFTLGSCSVAQEHSPSEITSNELVERTRQAYARCSSYTDSGDVMISIFGGLAELEITGNFHTHLLRPNLFRIEYREKLPFARKESYYTVLKKNGEITSLWDVTGSKKSESSLSMALVGATGVTHGSAYTIPRLLFPTELAGRELFDINIDNDVNLVTFETAECYLLTGKSKTASYEITIDRKSFLIRKIVMERRSGGKKTKQITTYRPEIEVDLNESIFVLKQE